MSELGRICLKMMERVGSAHGNGGRHIVLGFLAVELAAHVVGDSHPVERGQDEDQQPERRLQNQISSRKVNRHDDRADDDDGVEKRQRRPDFDQALAQNIQLAAEISQQPLRPIRPMARLMTSTRSAKESETLKP